MYFNFNYDNEARLNGLIIRPDKNDDPDVLHNYSKILKIRNPAIRFSELAKMGKFNECSDQDYSVMLNSIKEFDRLFFMKKVDVNVFQLLADMTEYILQNNCFLPQDNSNDVNKKDIPKSPWD